MTGLTVQEDVCLITTKSGVTVDRTALSDNSIRSRQDSGRGGGGHVFKTVQ